MSTIAGVLELTYEGIGKDMIIHRYPRHRRITAREHVQYRHRRRQAIEQRPSSDTLMQHRKDTTRKTPGITNLETETDRAKDNQTRPDVQQRDMSFVQSTTNPHEEETLPPVDLPQRQKPHPLPQGPAKPESTQHLPIPPDLIELAHYINHLPRNTRGRRKSTKTQTTTNTRVNNNDANKTPNDQTPPSFSSSPKVFDSFPSRNMLKRDPNLKGAISRKTGCLLLEKSGKRLRGWWGDERLFSKGLWRFLTEEGGQWRE